MTMEDDEKIVNGMVQRVQRNPILVPKKPVDWKVAAMKRNLDNRNTVYFCPHCEKTFTYQEMWRAIVKVYPSIWELQSVLKMCWATIRRAIRSFKLDIKVAGTTEHIEWHVLAKKAGYTDPFVMFYDLLVRKHLTYIKMARLLDVKREKIIEVRDTFLNPRFLLRSKKIRIKRGRLVGINLEEAKKFKERRRRPGNRNMALLESTLKE